MKVVMVLFALMLSLTVMCCATAQAQDDDEGYSVPDSTAAADAVKRLNSRDSQVRQRAAEELARLSASDWRHLVEGYRLQEDNARVKLALDWALYRVGKTETLYSVVRDLDSSRFAQAQGYLAQLDNPEPLYSFLETAKDKVKVRLLETLARTGDAGTIERIKPYANALDPQVARAAQASIGEIETRLARTPPDAQSRPRRVGNKQDEETEP